MIDRFILQLHEQHEWAWLLAVYLFLGSLGGALYLLVWIFALPATLALMSIALVALGALTLLFKLGNPLRAWRAMFRPGTSWISRGVFSVSSFLVFACLAAAPDLMGSPFLFWTPGAGKALEAIAALCALATAIYPGFVVASARAIPFWRTPILPLLFFTYSLMAAAGIVLVATAFTTSPAAGIELLASGLVAVNLLLLALYLGLTHGMGGAARESVRRLSEPPLHAVFWIGVVLVGLLVPLLLVWFRSGPAFAGICLLLGGLLLRYCVLKAGVYDVPALAPAGVDFSKLNRTSGDFEREYGVARAGERG
ncbi:MAG: DmsC/YnfH family molybdoenzyme membrane anchor subunit [Bradyrhizobium sp.]